jgi:hypothetical protein
MLAGNFMRPLMRPPMGHLRPRLPPLLLPVQHAIHELMTSPALLDFAALTELASRSEAVTVACACNATPTDGWQTLPLSMPEAQLHVAGTLAEQHQDDATFAEYHPDGTRYWSADAPIAPRYFPYNRCTVSECTVCGRSYLRYVEGGGYFVDQRIRQLKASLLVDAAL